ncbi:MAG: hypothetical protein RLZZ165_169 [Bacteroidota bacterium]
MPLLSDIQKATGGRSACSFLQVPVNAIRSAADSLDNMKNHPPAGVRQLADSLQRIKPPKIEGVDVLEKAIRSLRTQLPDASDMTKPISDSLGKLFSSINSNLSGKLDGMLSSFSGLDAFANLGGSSPVDESLATRLQAMQSILDAIPNPLDVPALLQFLQTGVEKFPRGIFKSRYLPIIDELREKLQTVLRWNTMNGTQIVDDVASTVQKLEAFIKATFIEDGIGPVVNPLTTMVNEFDEVGLNIAMGGLKQAITTVATAVRSRDLSSPSSLQAIANLEHHRDTMLAILQAAQRREASLTAAKTALKGLPLELENRAIHLLSVIQPPRDLDALGLLLEPFSQVLGNSGLSMIIGKLEGFVGGIKGMLDGLNISSFKAGFLDVLQSAEGAVNSLREVLMKVSIEFSALMNRVKTSIQGLGIGSAVKAMEDGLRNFTKLVRQTADTIFSPVRDFLRSIFTTINGLLEKLDPTVAVEALRGVMSKFTDLLGNPQLLHAIDSVKGVLDRLNTELGTFTFKPGTDIVVDGIEIVQKALETASSLPLPDSLKKDLRSALNKLPRSLDPAVEKLSSSLDKIIDEGPRPALLAFKAGPAKLVEVVNQYSPQKLVSECLGNTYQDFLTEMERFKPSSLLVPIMEALEVVKKEVRRIANPESALAPLQGPFNELIALLDAFDPEALIAPLNDQLQDGIQAIIEILPIGAANAIFDQVAAVTQRLQGASDTLKTIYNFLEAFRLRFAGLANARQQARTLGDAIAARISQVGDITPVTTAMASLGAALADVQAAGLTARLNAAINGLQVKFKATNAKTAFAQIASAIQAFPLAELRALPPSLSRDNVQAFLRAFDPLSSDYVIPVDMIDRLPGQLQEAMAPTLSFLANWNQRFFQPAGPIMQLQQPALTSASLKTLLSQTIEGQLMQTLDPVMKMVQYMQGVFDGVVKQVSALTLVLNGVLADVKSIGKALEELKAAVNKLIATLLGFDLGFLASGFRTVFDTVKTEIMAFSPTHIAKMLGNAFGEILSALGIDSLLGTATLDAEYTAIVENLRRLDPRKILVDSLQPEFEKVLAFLRRFDLSAQIDGFLSMIDLLKLELRSELTRVSGAYEGMWNAVPQGVTGVTGVKVILSLKSA